MTPFGDKKLNQHWLRYIKGLMPDGTKPLPEPKLTFWFTLQPHASPEGQWIKGMWWLVDYNVLQRYILKLLIVVGWHICDIYMCQWTGSSLVHVIACRMLGAKSLPEPILQLDPRKYFQWNRIEIQQFPFEKMCLKMSFFFYFAHNVLSQRYFRYM